MLNVIRILSRCPGHRTSRGVHNIIPMITDYRPYTLSGNNMCSQSSHLLIDSCLVVVKDDGEKKYFKSLSRLRCSCASPSFPSPPIQI